MHDQAQDPECRSDAERQEERIAHKGNSWLGVAFKGERHRGPDFAEAGKQILIGLELGSSNAWQLAERDLLCSEAWYGEAT